MEMTVRKEDICSSYRSLETGSRHVMMGEAQEEDSGLSGGRESEEKTGQES